MAQTAQVESAIIPASVFNRIPLIEGQVHRIAAAHLRSIGELFLKHNVHEQFCVGLLHRHYELRDGQIMLHRSLKDDTDICRACTVQDVQGSALIPDSLFLDDEQNFQAFEYRLDGPPPCLDTQFLVALRGLLVALGLEAVVSLVSHSALSVEGESLLETLLPGISGMLSAPRREDKQHVKPGVIAVVTRWSFCRDQDGGVMIVEVGECKKNGAGVHQVVEN